MRKIVIILSVLLPVAIYAQAYDYAGALDWVIETFSRNDAGFQYIIDKKGESDYNRHTLEIKQKVSEVDNDDEFIDLVYSWLHFFRKSHLQFDLKDNPRKKSSRSHFYDNQLHLDVLSDQTLYFRIPSFEYGHKNAIDSVINANRELITSTPNLILDIRNGTGGSDASFRELLPILYTNPIKQTGVLFKGGEFNARGFERYAEMTSNTSLNNTAELLRRNDGKFVDVDGSGETSYIRFDNVLPYPQRVAIMVNGANVSADEQFLIYAKQSWKVKLFGHTTAGGIDVSNLTYVFSPDDKFVLVYGMSLSKRLPDFEIDDIGLQPDFLIEDEIPASEWVDYTKNVLEQ